MEDIVADYYTEEGVRVRGEIAKILSVDMRKADEDEEDEEDQDEDGEEIDTHAGYSALPLRQLMPLLREKSRPRGSPRGERQAKGHTSPRRQSHEEGEEKPRPEVHQQHHLPRKQIPPGLSHMPQ